jgi:flagellar biosynthesis/type III secretory pathway protein FliH
MAKPTDPRLLGSTPEGWMWEELSVSDRPDFRVGADSPGVPNHEEELEVAFRQGMAKGEETGADRIRQEMAPALEAVHQAAQQLAELRTHWVGEMEKNLTALALGVARQMVDREVKENPEIISGLVGRALAHFPLDHEVRIRVNPLDLSSISGGLPGDESRAPVSAGREVHWIPDASISRGGCVVEGPERIVDGRLETALERVYRRLTDG